MPKRQPVLWTSYCRWQNGARFGGSRMVVREMAKQVAPVHGNL